MDNSRGPHKKAVTAAHVAVGCTAGGCVQGCSDLSRTIGIHCRILRILVRDDHHQRHVETVQSPVQQRQMVQQCCPRDRSVTQFCVPAFINKLCFE